MIIVTWIAAISRCIASFNFGVGCGLLLYILSFRYPIRSRGGHGSKRGGHGMSPFMDIKSPVNVSRITFIQSIHAHRQKKKGPIISTFYKAYHTVTFSLCRGFRCNSLEFSLVQYWQFCWLTWPSRWKCASSEVMITARSSWRIFNMCSLNYRLWAGSCGFGSAQS